MNSNLFKLLYKIKKMGLNLKLNIKREKKNSII